MEIYQLYELFKQSTGVTTDTRNIKQNQLFFALKGDSFNGNTFAEKALEIGASYTQLLMKMNFNKMINAF
jgi:UDP-N-acetylmuramoyl-tripeptide--D-alanyl-D-alanine ligase